MIVKYAPSGGEEKSWEYKAEELPSVDAEDIEDAMGITFDEFQMRLMSGGAKARRALLWIHLRRDNGTLKFRDVAFRMGELSVDFDADELKRLRDAIVADKSLSADVKESALSVIDAQGPAEAPKDR